MHRFNRFYLLGSIVFAFIVPSFTITVAPYEFIEPVVQEFQMIEQMQTSDVAFAEETEINYMNYVYGLYIIISGILCFFFVKNLFKILSKTKKNEKVSYYDATVILLKEKILPHTFLKYIFINKNEYANDQQEQLILTHELAHVKQKHSIDVLFIELLQIIFWCIPVFKLYKKAIQLNHEFLADDAVIKLHKNISEYQHILLNTSAQNNNIYLASNLNYSLTKKRLLMMTTPSSKTKILLKKLMLIPLTAGFIFAFAQRVEAQEKKQKPQVVETKNKNNKPTEEELYKDYAFKNVVLKYTNKEGKKVDKSYFEMTAKEQKMLGNPMPLLLKKKVPTQKLITDLKDSKKYAIWIDEKVVSNTVLDNYSNTDFSSFVVSFVYKNARSKRFPQNYQAHLTTNDFFKTRNEKRSNDFKNYKLKREKDPSYRGATKTQFVIRSKGQKEVSIKEMKEYEIIFKKVKNSELVKEKESIWMLRTYKRMSSKQKQAVGNLYKYIPENFFSKRKKPQVIEIKKQQKTTFHKNWFITIDGQKYFYTFDKNERIARYYKNGKLVKLDIVKEYKKKHKIYENLKATGKHYVFKSEKDKKEIDREFSDLGGMYFRMPRIDKNKVPFPNNPHGEYMKIRRKDGSHYYKKRSELNSEDKKLLNRRLPPPPALKKNATKKEIERYNKAYKFWKEKTKRLPPPPKPVKIEVIKNEKRPKVIEIIETPINEVEEVIEVRELIEVKEEIEEKEVEEVIEVRELIELKEVVEVEEIIESSEIVEQEIVTIDKINGLTNDEIIDINVIQDPEIKKVYYLNGKKISEKKYKKIKLKSIKKLFIKSEKDNIKHVYITTK